jgi:hypothetical protein
MSVGNGYAFIPGLEIEHAGPGDRSGVESDLTDIIGEIAKAKSAHNEACERCTVLDQSVEELQSKHSSAYAEWHAKEALGWDEAIGHPSSCATRELAIQLLPLKCDAEFLQNALDRARHILQPIAREHKLVTALDLRRLEAVEIALHAALSNISTQERLEKAGLFESEKRIFIVGEVTANLRAAAKEAHRQALLAERELNEERARQLVTQQTRLATGVITCAEVSSAVPACQGNIT